MKPVSPTVVIPKSDVRNAEFPQPAYIPRNLSKASSLDDDSSTSSMMEIDHVPDGLYTVWAPGESKAPQPAPTGLIAGTDEDISKLMTGMFILYHKTY